MEKPEMKHLRELYGIHPDVPPIAFQFPRLPPGLSHPVFKVHTNQIKEKFSNDANTLNKKLEDFKQMYQKFANGLFEMNFSGIVPPNHPLYTRKNSIETLQNENSKLQKENLELKKQIENINKEKQNSH